MDLHEIRTLLSSSHGPNYWRSLEEIANTPEFQAIAADEFPNRQPDWASPHRRREFLKVMAASLALAGVSSCTKQPAESIVPYVNQPEDLVPGKPLFYATAFPLAGFSSGILVESHMGRPTKIEGNPNHPASLGACDKFGLASILNLYDPDRSQTVMHAGSISSWAGFVGAVGTAAATWKESKGAGLRILTGIITSPALALQIRLLEAELPLAKWHRFDPLAPGGAIAGAVQAFGQPFHTIYHFDRAQRIVSLDADFLGSGPAALRYTRNYATRRRNGGSRLYQAEGTPSITSGMADHRLRMRTGDVESFAAALASQLGVRVPPGPAPPVPAETISAIASDLREHQGESIVIAGDYQPPNVHALAHAMNQALGSAGRTVTYTAPVEAAPTDSMQSLSDLAREMQAGSVETLLILGPNPVHEAPANLQFADAMGRVKLRVHLGEYYDETAALCHWHVPQCHYLETWGDGRAFDGTIAIQQPLIAPLYGSKSIHEILSVVSGFPDRTAHAVVKDHWRSQRPERDFDQFWQTSLHDGIVAGSALPPATVPAVRQLAPAPNNPAALELVFRPDPSIGAGLFSNNGWLQELPKPQNKMTWENAVWISPTTAQQLHLATGDVVEIQNQESRVNGPVWVLPGHADNSVTIHLGYGRKRAGHVGDKIGFSANIVRTANSPWTVSGAALRSVGGKHEFASTQHTQAMEGRDPVRVIGGHEHHEEGHAAHPEMSLFPQFPYDGYKWAMTIDLDACVGCHACAVACQAENNIPVVGKEETAKGRHMNWLRIDRYYHGSLDDPELYFQPVPCMQCENAPCELVCPVGATVHSGDGLNQMVYNRCVGTRYCSNNCPYKVRRFNFYLYSDWYTKSLYGLRNPDVSVRSRGVMEKCTYCIQRINRAKIESDKEDRRIRDGEILTACQQACSAQAIVFGDLNTADSRISRTKADPRNYLLLEELNTRPRTTYLTRLRNPNPALEKG